MKSAQDLEESVPVALFARVPNDLVDIDAVVVYLVGEDLPADQAVVYSHFNQFEPLVQLTGALVIVIRVHDALVQLAPLGGELHDLLLVRRILLGKRRERRYRRLPQPWRQ